MELIYGTQHRAVPRHWGEKNGNINLNKYLISLSGDQTHSQLHLHIPFVPLNHEP